jgi:hypothetical protein
MRPTRFLIIFILPVLMPSPLDAQGTSGAYCAQFSDGSSPDCGFATYQMCLQSVTGIGGVCNINPAGPPRPRAQYQGQYTPPVAAAPRPASTQAPPCNPLIDGTYCASAGVTRAPAPQSPAGISSIQSLSSDLGIGDSLDMGGAPPATLGAITFSSNGNCIGLFRRTSCGG